MRTNCHIFWKHISCDVPSSYNVIDHHIPDLCVVDNPTHISSDWFGIDAGGYRSAGVDFGLNFGNNRAESARVIRVRSVFGHRRVRERRHGVALSVPGAGSTRVDSGTRSIDMRTKPFVAVRRTRQIRLAGVVGDEAGLLNEFIRPGMAASIATSGNVSTAVQHVLDRQIDFGTLRLLRDLDPIGERAQSAVGPATKRNGGKTRRRQSCILTNRSQFFSHILPIPKLTNSCHSTEEYAGQIREREKERK